VNWISGSENHIHFLALARVQVDHLLAFVANLGSKPSESSYKKHHV